MMVIDDDKNIYSNRYMHVLCLKRHIANESVNKISIFDLLNFFIIFLIILEILIYFNSVHF